MSVVRDLFIKACTVMFMVSNGTKDGGGISYRLFVGIFKNYNFTMFGRDFRFLNARNVSSLW